MDNILTSFVELITYLKTTDSNSPCYFVDTATTPRGLRRVFFGDPNQIPQSDFTACIVRPVATNLIRSGSRMDVREHDIEVVLVDNLKNYSNDNPTDPNKVQSLATMLEMMESADVNQKISGSCIVGKLLQNQRLPYTDSEENTQYAALQVLLQSIDYVFNTSRGFPTFETIALFRVTTQGDRA